MIAISAGSRSKASMPPASISASSAERLDRRAQGDDPVRVAELADEPAGGVDLDDVAAMDALLDPVADLADEDRRDVRPGSAGRPARADVRPRRRAGLAGTVTVDGSPIGWVGGVPTARRRSAGGSRRDREDTASLATMGDT